MLNIAATSPSGATGEGGRTVVQDVPPGKLLYETADPRGDDNGPGNYALSDRAATSTPGAYDLEAFQVFDAGDRSSSACACAT